MEWFLLDMPFDSWFKIKVPRQQLKESCSLQLSPLWVKKAEGRPLKSEEWKSKEKLVTAQNSSKMTKMPEKFKKGVFLQNIFLVFLCGPKNENKSESLL